MLQKKVNKKLMALAPKTALLQHQHVPESKLS
jgi:hypothetical protein